GNLTLYVVAFRQGQQAFQSVLSAIGGMYEDNLYMSNLWSYLAIPTGNGTAKDPPALPAAAEAGIRFQGVGFRYPGQEKWALRGIVVLGRRGQGLGRVAPTGAGKPTFITLLPRLYEPTEGRILLDGRDLREWPADQLLRRIGVIFQDFNQYQLKLRENVGVGSVEHMEDEVRLRRAIEHGGGKEGGAGLGAGLGTPVGRGVRGGAARAGGAW